MWVKLISELHFKIANCRKRYINQFYDKCLSTIISLNPIRHMTVDEVVPAMVPSRVPRLVHAVPCGPLCTLESLKNPL